MTTSYNIYSAEAQTRSNAVAASDGGFPREKENSREVQQIVADLAKNKTAWLYEPERDEARAWAGLR